MSYHDDMLDLRDLARDWSESEDIAFQAACAALCRESVAEEIEQFVSQRANVWPQRPMGQTVVHRTDPRASFDNAPGGWVEFDEDEVEAGNWFGPHGWKAMA